MRRQQRDDLSAKLLWQLVWVLLCVAGCHHPDGIQPRSPAVDLQQTYAEFVHGHLDKAEAEAAVGRAQTLHSNPQLSFRFCLLQADLATWQGHSEKVVQLLHACDMSFAPSGDMAIKEHLLLSLALSRLGNAEQSAEELKSARESPQKPSRSMEAEMYRTTGLLQSRSGQMEAGIESLETSLAIAREQKDTFLEAANLINLGAFAIKMERDDEALNWFNASAKVAESIQAAAIAQIDLGNAGWVYYELGDFERALSSFQQAEVQARRLGSSDNEILWQQSAGLALFRLGKIDLARSDYEAALKRSEQAGDAPQTVTAQTSLGLLFLQLGRFDTAKTYADAALGGARAIGDVSSELDALFLQAMVAAHSPVAHPEATLLSVYRSTTNQSSLRNQPSLRWQMEAALAGLYAGKHEDQRAEMWFRRSIQTFETQRTSIRNEENRLPFFANGETLYRSYAEFLIAHKRSDEALYLLDKARARTLDESFTATKAAAEKSSAMANSSGAVEAFEAKRVAARLVAEKQSGVMLFYSLGPQTSWLWAISAKRIERFVLPAEAEIAGHVDSYQASILRSSDPLREGNADAQWLYRTLVAPAETVMGDRKDIFIVRNGKLNNLNFETLLKPGPQGLHYWVDDARITNASSIKLLARAARRERGVRSGSARLLLIGNPVSASSDYAALRNAGAEVEGVAGSFPDSRRTVFTQAEAVPAAYMQGHPESYDYIHFVAHGTASTLRPLDSAVVLSAPAAQPDGFRLYARDVVRLPLNSELVTISACYGSGTRNYAGEGLVGLSWAFLRAGSHNVIGALWAVDDASTAQLMNRLYKGLSTGEHPSEALQQAKLAMLHTDGVYRKPFYWAGFQLYSGS